MHTALTFPVEIDPAMLMRVLSQMQIGYRINYQDNLQVLLVERESDIERAREIFHRLSREGMLPPRNQISFYPTSIGNFVRTLRRYPATLTLVVITLALFPATFGLSSPGGSIAWLSTLTFVPFTAPSGNLVFGTLESVLQTGQFWRLLTPMFIHFGTLHIVFNLLWVWEVGRRIEVICGIPRLLMVVLVSSLCANVLQYLYTGPSLYGGMSGVVFGLLGFGFVWSRMRPRASLGLPDGIYVAMLVLLIIGFSGVLDFAMVGAVANGAHLGGLLSGLFLGAVSSLRDSSATQ